MTVMVCWTAYVQFASLPQRSQDLLILEEQDGSVNFKFGVIYMKAGQTVDDDMYSNGESWRLSHFVDQNQKLLSFDLEVFILMSFWAFQIWQRNAVSRGLEFDQIWMKRASTFNLSEGYVAFQANWRGDQFGFDTTRLVKWDQSWKINWDWRCPTYIVKYLLFNELRDCINWLVGPKISDLGI